jgi:hypothetical protein
MKAETLRVEVVSALQAFAWDQWSQLGISGAMPSQREERAADPEALLLFTLEVARTDPRLFDEVLDWLALNEPLISVHRLRNLSTDAADRMLVDAALAWVAGVRGRKPPAVADRAEPADLRPLFPILPSPRRDLDAPFARHGLARPPLLPSKKSRPPELTLPISFAFRLRHLLGVGVRAEVIRALLTIRAPRISGKVIAASAGFQQRNVRWGLQELQDAGVIDVFGIAGERRYSVAVQDWATLLRLDDAPSLPFHHDWIPTYRSLTRMTRFLGQPGLDELSLYQRASQARTLVDAVAADLRLAGVSIGTYPRGDAFWDAFVEITRMAVRAAQGTGPVRFSSANQRPT